MLNIVIAGVGGQGTLLASKILGQLGLNHGYDVKVSEVHGMSQRGGSVITYVRLSKEERLYSSVVEQGKADVLLAFECLEALRSLPYVKPGGTVIVNTQEIMPMPVITGAAKYPDGCLGQVKAKADVIALDAIGIAKECGSNKAVNTVLMGVLAKKLPFSRGQWHSAIVQNVKPEYACVNRNAFDRGYYYGENS